MSFTRAFFILFGAVGDGAVDFEVLRICGFRIQRKTLGHGNGEEEQRQNENGVKVNPTTQATLFTVLVIYFSLCLSFTIGIIVTFYIKCIYIKRHHCIHSNFEICLLRDSYIWMQATNLQLLIICDWQTRFV